ncbi:recombination associated protein RdgC [Vibrio xiamenensis]|uniref:Recombination-associated protein RdgC n=2 Tax=Vibrio xiamenensis TaxID=861298 RepID=A0A1G8HPK8_9VIBR|nr:recombination associated protein RdgC [Vibrio xiamenensis]
MIFPKNAMVYRLNRNVTFDLEKLETQLKEFSFTPCLDLDKSKFGWTPALGEQSELFIHSGAGCAMIVAKKEVKDIPSQVIKSALDERVKALEELRGGPLKKGEKDDLKDDVMQALLPRAFSKFTLTPVFIDMDNHFIVVDCSSFSAAEQALALLRKTIGSLPVVPAIPERAIESTLTEWVKHGELESGFSILEDIKLVSVLADGGTATFKRQDVGSDEVKSCIDADKMVSELRLDWQERIEFTLSEKGTIKKLKFSDVITDQNDDIPMEDQFARLDADFHLVCGELRAFLKDLYVGLGGLPEGDAPQAMEDEQFDSLIPEAKKHIVETQRASISNLQRHFKIGYNRAARIVEALEELGVVSSESHNGLRSVLITAEETE